MPTREELHEVRSLGTVPEHVERRWRLVCSCGWIVEAPTAGVVETIYDVHREHPGAALEIAVRLIVG